MVRKIIVLTLLCLVNSCAAQEKTTNKKLLVYDNYTDKKELLPISLDKYRLKNIVLHKKDTLKVDIPSYKGVILNKEDKLFHFLCEQDIISGWLQLKDEPDSIMTKDSGMIYAKMNKEEMVKMLKSTITTMKLVGKVELTVDVTSILIQIDKIFKEDYLIIKGLYMLNIKKGKILSIAKIASFFSDEFSTFRTYVTKQSKYAFILHHDLISTDDIGPEDEALNEEPPQIVVFSINKDGKVLLLD